MSNKLFSQFDQFAQCTSHTLSDPVRKIIALCNNTDNPQDTIAMINQDANNLLDTIKALRKYSFFILKPTKLKQIQLQNLIQELKYLLEDNNIEQNIITNLPDQQDIVLTADITQITDALFELITNAIKFNAQTPSIQIGYSDNVSHHILSVYDNANAVDEIYLNKIFALSVRGDNSDNIPGDGIGLACVDAIAHNHQGKAWGNLKEQGGSIFSISISKELSSNV